MSFPRLALKYVSLIISLLGILVLLFLSSHNNSLEFEGYVVNETIRGNYITLTIFSNDTNKTEIFTCDYCSLSNNLNNALLKNLTGYLIHVKAHFDAESNKTRIDEIEVIK